MNPKFLSIKEFDYRLPSEKIAEFPLKERDSSKLLVYEKGEISEDSFSRLSRHLPENSFLIFNDTRVLNARILFQKATGAIIEVFLLEPANGISHEEAFQSTGNVLWKCMIGKAGKWKEPALEKVIHVKGQEVVFQARLIEKLVDSYVCELSWTPGHFAAGEVIEAAGVTPLPPYIKRQPEESDKERYQSIFSREEGSVAAPTASLHFTEEVFNSLAIKGVQHDFVTLHVGAGTFKPIKSVTMEGHEMHAEYMDIRAAFLKNLLAQMQKEVYCVGTTSLRTVESLYWMGLKTLENPKIDYENLMVKQWEVYEEKGPSVDASEAIESLLAYVENHDNRLLIPTQILIAPGYRYRIVNGIVTNFHQPKSTLLLLVAALVGNKWHEIYEYALKNDFRFLSYGDACLLKP